METVSASKTERACGVNIKVIIPMFGFGELTDRCIDACKKNAGIEHDILVVDDCSETPYENPNAATIRIKERSGCTKALNIGLRALRLNYDYVLLLNNDTIPQPDFLKNLVECAESDKGIGIVGSTRITCWNPYREAGPGMDLTTGLVRYVTSPNDWEGPIHCIWMTFCSVLFSRALVEYAGLLDEKLINHCQDNDYCLRSIFMGFANVVEPHSKVFHYQSVTIHSLNITPYDDQITFARKWFAPAMNEILNVIPINYEMKKYGIMGFRYEIKDDSVGDEKRIVLAK